MEFRGHVVGRYDIAVREMAEVEFHCGLKAPFQRDFIDRLLA
jgi:hypothetical protein